LFSVTDIESFLFIDIETAHGSKNYEDLSPILQKHWAKKAQLFNKINSEEMEKMPNDLAYYSKAAIFAEFNRVVCVSLAYINFNGEKPQGKFKTYFDVEESKLLYEVKSVIEQIYQKRAAVGKQTKLCGHNIREFDVPVLGRRMLIHGIPLPYHLQIQGKKPWEIALVDTMELWKFGDYKSFTSLELLAELFGIDSPKIEMSGEDVSRIFWHEDNKLPIIKYCEADVLTVMQLILRMSNMNLIETETNQ
jgi:DNA polymerase elongation subunit (family B)